VVGDKGVHRFLIHDRDRIFAKHLDDSIRALGPGVPDPPRATVVFPKTESRHRLPAGALVLAKSIVGGLHHEYYLATARPGA
jgi:hypothetical protein